MQTNTSLNNSSLSDVIRAIDNKTLNSFRISSQFLGIQCSDPATEREAIQIPRLEKTTKQEQIPIIDDKTAASASDIQEVTICFTKTEVCRQDWEKYIASRSTSP